VQWVLGIDVPATMRIGGGFCVWHGQGLVIHERCIIGENVTARHNTTIGQKHDDGGAPVIGNNVNISAQCIIIGEITIGDNCKIGAGTLINKTIPPGSLVYGNPFIIKPLNK
jgi:serine acetyltransferase